MRWFTSDHHFFHTNVIKYCNRPFKDVEEMNDKMVLKWNEVVQPEDVVYYLGDFALSHKAVTVFLPQLNGMKHLISGNHDLVHPIHSKKEAKYRKMMNLYYENGFSTICTEKIISICGRPTLLCHMPPYPSDVPDTADVRYPEWRPVDIGQWILHGHVHNIWKKKNKWINVGVDVWDFYPVSETQIEQEMHDLS